MNRTHVVPSFTRRLPDGREESVCGQFVTAAQIAPAETTPSCWGCSTWLTGLEFTQEPARDAETEVRHVA